MVLMYFCLSYITNPMYIEKMGEMVPPPSQKTVGVCNQITVLILYYISSKLVTLLKVTDAHIQDSDISKLTVSLKFLKFSFHIFLFFPWNVR
jgi:hypothetical protein